MTDITNKEQLDFAVIGHQDNWQNIESFINGMRSVELERMPLEKIKETYCFIPPRSIFKMKVKSKNGSVINGVYIESFIDPDKLDASHLRTNIEKVNEAITKAQNLNAKIIALGGFTSIVLEGNLKSFNTEKTKITTGNSLTTAYILRGVKKASEQLNIEMKDGNVLIIGATGDIGMACTNYLKGKVGRLLLCARNLRRLEKFSRQVSTDHSHIRYSTDLNALLPEADIIISAASSRDIRIIDHKRPVIICDAGYPKNLELKIGQKDGISVFHGGMGQICYGYDFSPDYTRCFYRYPAPYIGHGCVLEAIVLAFEKIYENYSVGKGNISNWKIDEIYELGLKHGLELAPFYNASGLWN